MAAKKPITAKPAKLTEATTVEQMRELLVAKQADLVAAKRGHAAGELANPRVLTTTRKEIARLHTAIRAAGLALEGSK